MSQDRAGTQMALVAVRSLLFCVLSDVKLGISLYLELPILTNWEQKCCQATSKCQLLYRANDP